MKKIWIDITNSPHAILFNPIIKELKKRNYEVVVTARDYAQTIELLDMFEIEYTLFDKHRGKSSLKKIIGLISRSWALYKFGRKQKFDASLSMSSQYAMIASKMLGVPHMTLYDYEYATGHHISFRLSKQILTPKGVDENTLKKFGAKLENVVYYPGLKEQFYIKYYMDDYNNKYEGKPNPIRSMFNISDEDILIVIRPEATVSHYQNNENPFSFELVEYLSKHEKKPTIIVIPRTSDQKTEYLKRNYDNVIIPKSAINGIELVASADLVIGAGGTVNREAAAVGTPAYTIFNGGKFAAVDRMLIETKRMIKLDNMSDIDKLIIEKRTNKPAPVGEDFTSLYIELVERLLKKRR